MKLKITLLFFSIFLFLNGKAQVTNYPSVAKTNCKTCKIISIVIEDDKTIVTIEYAKSGVVSFSNTTYIVDSYNENHAYPILSLGRNQLNTSYSTTGKKGQETRFELVFPRIGPGTERINIIEVAKNGDGFEWFGIQVDNPDNSPTSLWTETLLKTDWEKNGIDYLEGIYEGTVKTEMSSKYRLAIKANSDGYDVIYLSGVDKNWTRWKEGDIKGRLFKTAKENFYKVKWLMANKVVNENLFVTFEEAIMKILWTEEKDEQLYLKLYPNKSSNVSISAKNVPSSGTGFALSSTGLILTNFHVIEGAKLITIKGVNGDFNKGIKATVVVNDKNNDLAILQIEDNGSLSNSKIPYTIKQSSSDVGENIFVLGYPLRAKMGDEIKLTNGIISSKTGFQGDITSYQVSVPIQPGNSGGPLFDKFGNLIGIINAKLKGGENVSYAIKVSYLRNLMDLLPIQIIDSSNILSTLSLSEQVKILNKFVYIVETE